MKQLVRALVHKTPYIKNFTEQIRRQGAFPAGHYYSPIPSNEDVVAYLKSRKSPDAELPGIELNAQAQFESLTGYVALYREIQFPAQKSGRFRYYYDNAWFGYADAFFLYGFLKTQLPSQIIEIGSGFSSAVMLDAIDGCFSKRPKVLLIEPYPGRLLELLREGDLDNVTLMDRKVQDVPLETLLQLNAGDILFIDSSHVVKCGSDVQFLMFEVLPRLKPGVVVHFHDIFYPFDEPTDWLMEGRYWNENYFLRAFLSYNSAWSIRFFNSYIQFRFGDFMKDKMPLCARYPGGSLYIQHAPLAA